MDDADLVAGPAGNVADAPERRVEWEVPEVVAVAVLVAVGILVLGGLATGIAAAAGAPMAFGQGAGAATAGSSIQLGAVWAGPLLAMVLLGVLGLSWWQVDTWNGASSDADPTDVAGHVRRGQRIALWVIGSLVLTLAGSVALFAGLLLTNSHAGNLPSLVWSRDIYEGASVLAVAVIAAGGIWAGTRLRPGPDDGTPLTTE